MITTVFIGLIIFTIWDATVLKERNEERFHVAFDFPQNIVRLLLLFLAIAFIFSSNRWEVIILFLTVGILPIYLLRRYRFIRSIADIEDDTLLIMKSDALGVAIIWIFSAIMISSFINAFLEVFPGFISELGGLIISACVSSIIVLVLIYHASERFSKDGFWVNVGLKKDGPSFWKVFILPCVLGLFFALISANIIVGRAIQPQTPLNDVLSAANSPLAMLGFIGLAILFAPFIEEIIFRGYFFHVIRAIKGERFAIYCIALTFAFLHVGQYWGDWMAILMVTLLGFTLTILRSWTNTTMSSVVMHYVYNASVTIIPVIMIIFSNPAYFKYQVYYPYIDADTKEELLITSIKNQPDLADAYNDLAWLYTEEDKNLDEALKLVNQALSFYPEEWMYLDTKAQILTGLGKLSEAKEIRQAILDQENLTDETKKYQNEKIEEIMMEIEK